MEKRLEPYIESIIKWVKKYMPAPLGQNDNFDDGSTLVSVTDIEESLWDPIIGIKGKVDVTLQVFAAIPL